MPFTLDPPFPKSRNDTVRSKDTNDIVGEVIRLDGAKVDRAGDTLSGPLTISGTLGVGGPAEQRRVQVGGDVAGIGLDESNGSPDAGYIRFGDNSGWKLHLGRSREVSGAELNVDTTGVLATLQDNGNLGLGALAPRSRLQVKSLTALDEGATAAGAWANIGSNAFYDGDWHRVDETKAAVNLHMNGEGAGAEFRFLRIEADGSNLRNVAQIGSNGLALFEGGLDISGPTPNRWKLNAPTNSTGGDSALGVLCEVNSQEGGAIGAEFTANVSGNANAFGSISIASASGSGQKIGVYGGAGGGSGPTWAGYFNGNVNVAGTLSKGGGGFLIDHVLDPENKVLRHNFVESPEHLCAYRGKAWLGDHGRATVELPDYFPALTDEQNATVHLTPVGEEPSAVSYRWNDEYSALTVFGAPHAEVAYLVLAARDDPVIHQLDRPVEEDKGGEYERGRLLYPEAFGHPPERGVAFGMEEAFAASRQPTPEH